MITAASRRSLVNRTTPAATDTKAATNRTTVVYKITKAIVEGREDFGRVTAAMKGVTPKQMAESHGMPIHPGAEKYFKEAGLAK